MVDTDQEVDGAFHDGRGKDERIPRAIENSVDGICELLVCCEGHVPRKAGSGGNGTLCGFATSQKAPFGTRDGTLCGIGCLKSKDDEEKGNYGIGDPSQ